MALTTALSDISVRNTSAGPPASQPPVHHSHGVHALRVLDEEAADGRVDLRHLRNTLPAFHSWWCNAAARIGCAGPSKP